MSYLLALSFHYVTSQSFSSIFWQHFLALLLRHSVRYVHVFPCQKRMQQVENLCWRFIIFCFIYSLKNLANVLRHVSEVGLSSHLLSLPRMWLLSSMLLLIGLVGHVPLCLYSYLHKEKENPVCWHSWWDLCVIHFLPMIRWAALNDSHCLMLSALSNDK